MKDSLILPCRIWLRVKFCHHLLGGVCHNLWFPPWKGDPVIRKTLKVKITSYSQLKNFKLTPFCFLGALAFHFKYSEFQGNFFRQRVDFSAVCNIFLPQKENLSNKMDEKAYNNDTCWIYFLSEPFLGLQKVG